MSHFGVVTQAFSANYEKVFAFLSDVKTLPEWTELFSEADDTSSLLQLPDGTNPRVPISITSSIDTGVVDWHITMPDGNIQTSYSRLTKLDDDQFIYSFMFVIPSGPEAEEMHAQLLQLIGREFDNLRKIFTDNPAYQK